MSPHIFSYFKLLLPQQFILNPCESNKSDFKYFYFILLFFVLP